MKRIISLVLVLLLIFSLTGCSKKEESFYGAWKTELDIVPFIQDAMDDYYFGLVPKVDQQIMLACYLRFDEDATYIIRIDEEDFETAVHTYLMAAVEPMSESIYHDAEKKGISREYMDEILAKDGFSNAEEYCTDMFNRADKNLDVNVNNLSTGTYELDFEENKILFTADGETSALPVSFTLIAKRLTLEVGEPIGELNFSKIHTWEMPETEVD